MVHHWEGVSGAEEIISEDIKGSRAFGQGQSLSGIKIMSTWREQEWTLRIPLWGRGRQGMSPEDKEFQSVRWLAGAAKIPPVCVIIVSK